MRERTRRAERAYLLSKRKNESGEHAGNRLGECMGNRSGEYAVARGMIGQTSIWKVGGEMVET